MELSVKKNKFNKTAHFCVVSVSFVVKTFCLSFNSVPEFNHIRKSHPHIFVITFGLRMPQQKSVLRCFHGCPSLPS